MRHHGNKICQDERTNECGEWTGWKHNAFADSGGRGTTKIQTCKSNVTLLFFHYFCIIFYRIFVSGLVSCCWKRFCLILLLLLIDSNLLLLSQVSHSRIILQPNTIPNFLWQNNSLWARFYIIPHYQKILKLQMHKVIKTYKFFTKVM